MKTASSTRKATSNASGVLQIPPNEFRVAIILTSPTGRTTLVQIGTADDNTTGLTLPSGIAPFVLSHLQIGLAIQDSITLIDSGGLTQTFAWTEIVQAP